MKRDNFVFLFSGVFFGVLVGWMLGSQQGGRFVPGAAVASAPAPGTMTGAATGAQQQASAPAPPPIDQVRVTALTSAANADPKNVSARTDLGNLYFDSERFDLAIPWYEAAFKLSPKDPNLSTDLGVSYLYTDKVDQAIAQFEKSVAADPKHLKSWLNIGIAKAMAKNPPDVKGGEAAWQKVIELAPGSEEAKKAQQGIDAIKGGNHGKGTGGL